MAQAASKGNCYLCGETISKTAFKKHLLEKHNDAAGDAQTCKLLKVEGADEKAYWLYLDMSVSATLKTLDRFLRDIWLECCGHESAFFVGNYEQLSKNTMVGMLRDGLKLHYEYDFGSTTELTITVVGTLLRPKQRRSVRLLGEMSRSASCAGNAERKPIGYAANANGRISIRISAKTAWKAIRTILRFQSLILRAWACAAIAERTTSIPLTRLRF